MAEVNLKALIGRLDRVCTRGLEGAAGAMGPEGTTGPTGSQGLVGATGPTGPAPDESRFYTRTEVDELYSAVLRLFRR